MMTVLIVVIFISFISLGLPDSALGAAWPAIYTEFDLPVSLAGYISATISLGTITSSLLCSKVTNKIGTGAVTAISISLTAIALLGFTFTSNPVFFFLSAIPLGLGAGAIDAALNNFVALHYSAAKMNFLHCFYGIGVAATPYIISFALGNGGNWRKGYLIITVIQFIILAIAVLSLPLWKKVELGDKSNADIAAPKALSLKELLSMPAVRTVCVVFFTSCALELSAGSWSSTYFVNTKGLPADKAAKIAMLFYIGLASGRFLAGILAKKAERQTIIRMAAITLCTAVVTFLLPLPLIVSEIALFFIGLGIGPIFPNLTHLTPETFGTDISQSVIGVQQAASYVGILIVPWLFGVLAQVFSTLIFPIYLLILCILFVISLIALRKYTKH